MSCECVCALIRVPQCVRVHDWDGPAPTLGHPFASHIYRDIYMYICTLLGLREGWLWGEGGRFRGSVGC